MLFEGIDWENAIFMIYNITEENYYFVDNETGYVLDVSAEMNNMLTGEMPTKFTGLRQSRGA